jgi:hypothetical protein
MRLHASIESIVMPRHVEILDFCAELMGRCEAHCHSVADIRDILRLGSELPVLVDCFMDFSGFECVAAIGSDSEQSSELHQSLSDGIDMAVSLIGRMEFGIGRVIEQRLNLKRPCIAVPLGVFISDEATELPLVRACASGGSLESVLSDRPG